MKNKFFNEFKPLLLILIITLVGIIIGFDISLAVYFCIYFVNLLVLPVRLKDNVTDVSKKIIITMVTFITSVLAITYFEGIGKNLYHYIVLFIIVIIYCKAFNFIKERLDFK